MSWITFQRNLRGAGAAVDEALPVLYPHLNETELKITSNKN